MIRDFIEMMRERDLVIDLEDEISPDFEAAKIAATTERLLFFHKIGGGRAIMNATTTRTALSLALRIDERSIVRTLSESRYSGEVVESSPLQMAAPSLSKLPILRHYPGDAGQYITSGILFSQYGDIQNASIHRMLVTDERHVVARIVEGRHTHLLLQQALSEGQRLPIAVTIGTHPAVTFASCTRVPKGRELPFAAELLGGEIEVHRCRNGVLVPEAEIVLEGFIGPERAEEGPFVDITGTYDPMRIQPVIEFTGMYTKSDPIYHGILPGGDEHKILMGAPYEPRIFQAVAGVTEVKDVVMTKGGCGYLHAVVQIKKSTQGDAKNAILAAFAAHTSLKHVVIVDEDISPSDPVEVEYALSTRVRGDQDLLVITGARGSSLDPCQLDDGTNVKIGIDATMRLGHEKEFTRARW